MPVALLAAAAVDITLGMPTIRGRAVQTAASPTLEAIFEADRQLEQHAYRENHGASEEVQDVHRLAGSCACRLLADCCLSTLHN